jgi:hypothetical protein
VVLDDVLTEPKQLLDLAERHREAFAPSPRNAFPGLELPMPERASWALAAALAAHFSGPLCLGELLDAQARLSMVTLPGAGLMPIQRLCHRDRLAQDPSERAIAGLLYLFDRKALGGTSFWTPLMPDSEIEALMSRMAQADNEAADLLLGSPSRYLTASNRYFSLRLCVPPRWNRFIAYDGGQFHSSHIEQDELLTDQPRYGRLTLNLFMRFRSG